MEDPHPQGQGLAEDVPAAEVGELMEEGKPQGVPGGRVLRKEKGGPEQPGQHGDGQAGAGEQAGAAVQPQLVAQGVVEGQNVRVPDGGGPAVQIPAEAQVGEQVPNQDRRGPQQPEAEDQLGEGEGQVGGGSGLRFRRRGGGCGLRGPV